MPLAPRPGLTVGASSAASKAAASDGGSPIKAAYFDIGNVLLRFDPTKVGRRLAWEVRRRPLKVLSYLWDSSFGERIETGRIGSRALYGLFRKELGFQGTYRRFKRLWCDAFEFRVDRKAVSILRRLSREIPVYLLSNTNHLHFDHIRRRYAFVRLVRRSFVSHRMGLRKPDAAIYKAALAEAGVKPHEAFFVDDLKENVEAARRVGMKALRYDKPESLEKELRGLGLLNARTAKRPRAAARTGSKPGTAAGPPSPSA